mgnify:FL=1
MSYWQLAHTATRFIELFDGPSSKNCSILFTLITRQYSLARRRRNLGLTHSYPALVSLVPTQGLTEEQKAAVVASFNEGVAKKTN